MMPTDTIPRLCPLHFTSAKDMIYASHYSPSSSSSPQGGKTPDQAVQNRRVIRSKRGYTIRKHGDRLGGEPAEAVGTVGGRRRRKSKTKPFWLRPSQQKNSQAIGRGGGRRTPARSFTRLERDFWGQGPVVVLCAGGGRHQEARVPWRSRDTGEYTIQYMLYV